jgi:hypothetical protein
VADAGHYIQRDQPDVVVDAARQLAGCTAGNDLPTASTQHTHAARYSSP